MVVVDTVEVLDSLLAAWVFVVAFVELVEQEVDLAFVGLIVVEHIVVELVVAELQFVVELEIVVVVVVAELLLDIDIVNFYPYIKEMIP